MDVVLVDGIRSLLSNIGDQDRCLHVTWTCQSLPRTILKQNKIYSLGYDRTGHHRLRYLRNRWFCYSFANYLWIWFIHRGTHHHLWFLLVPICALLWNQKTRTTLRNSRSDNGLHFSIQHGNRRSRRTPNGWRSFNSVSTKGRMASCARIDRSCNNAT